MKLLTRTFISWLPLAVAITGICLLVYATVQQNYRQSLNDPQIQMAEDGAAFLAKDYTPAALVVRGAPLTNIATSLSPWITVYDESGKPLESTAVLDGTPPHPPQGIFDAAKNGLPFIVGHHTTDDMPPGENRISWQPRSDVRSAIVVVHIPGDKGFVVAGRNMREVEEREENLGTVVILAWLVILAATFVTKAFADFVGKNM